MAPRPARSPRVWRRWRPRHRVRRELLPAVYAELDCQINLFANDRQQCFLDPEDGFPLRTELDGRYYIASETYEVEAGGPPVRLWIMVHCLESEADQDYLGLEAIVDIDPAAGHFRFDEGLTTSSM